MKTSNELFELLLKGTSKGDKVFFNFSGHVNKLSITYYMFGWNEDKEYKHECDVILNETGIQEAYWFLYNKLNK